MAETRFTEPHHDDHVHHERTDVNVSGVLLFAVGLFVVAAVVHLLIWVLFGFFDSREAVRRAREYPLAAAQENQVPPEPRLQTNPREDMRELRDREDEVLTSYGWVDKHAGIARIPIEEAMKIVVERGLPARQVPKGSSTQAGAQ
jgi:hypothetical protein